MDEDRGLMRREARRRKFEIVGLGLMALGMGGGGLAVAFDGPDVIVNAGAVMAIVGALTVLLAWRPKADRERLARDGTRRDRVQRARRRMMLTYPFASVGVLAFGLGAVWRVGQGQATFADLMWAGALPLLAWIVPVMVLGWDKEAREQKKWIEDELTREWRARSVSLGFVVLMAGLAAVYAVGLFRPDWAMLGLPVVLMVTAGTIGLRYVWLDARAEAGDV